MTVLVIVSAFISAVAGRALLAVAVSLHLFPEGGVSATGSWTRQVTDAWSLTANLGVALLFGYAFAIVLRSAVRTRPAAWDLKLWPVACTMALATGSDGGTAGLTAFALIVVVAKAVSLRLTSADRRRPRNAVVATTAICAIALLILTFSYQPLHPLLASFTGRSDPLSSLSLDSQEPLGRFLAFAFDNAGADAVVVRSIRPVGTNARELDVVPYGGVRWAGRTIPRGATAQGALRLSDEACAKGALRHRIPPVTIVGLEVRVETLGLVRTQRFDVSPSAALYCG
ncbi:MAG TPA: hypothetical protein VKB25_11685 [Conexibacter sp.]|nr:hypothetical protein [Conexibacter sp.]